VDYKGTVSLAHLLMIVAYMLACMYKLHILVNVVKIVEVSVILHVIGHWKDPLRSERIIYVSTIKASVIPQRNTLVPGGKCLGVSSEIAGFSIQMDQFMK
jgi:hypothetical protein